jgi:hypothetical protein
MIGKLIELLYITSIPGHYTALYSIGPENLIKIISMIPPPLMDQVYKYLPANNDLLFFDAYSDKDLGKTLSCRIIISHILWMFFFPFL